MGDNYDEGDPYAQGGGSYHDNDFNYMDDQYAGHLDEHMGAAGAEDGAAAHQAETNESEPMTGVVGSKNGQGNILDPNKSDTG